MKNTTDHIMKHDGLFIAYLAIIVTLLGMLGASMVHV
jgi:hypothetical protein